MAIYLARHGQDDERYRGGWSRRGLIEEGIRQSERLGQYLADRSHDYPINRIVSSDLSRAQQTAAIIADKLGIVSTSSESWRETNNGLLAGMPHSLAEENYPGLSFSSLDMDERYPGGESPRENFERIQAAFTRLCHHQQSADPDDNILVITHGGVINIIYHIIKNVEWSNKNAFYPAGKTGLHKMEYRDGKWAFTLENSTNHLQA
ncbi:alpha-ribazole phosphatase [Paenibacillus sp. JCM 10914]|uniref:histidine phosphatase family protein n=1 Tax=Paenibacillus sp. JCM 10914 TaxID=1236974 RepID=UPI0003CC6251|nr:histidine phosphatase family protein [Paenibacillus sp. JCM 10914]GAE09500.1 phosphoglycerate mutase family [Paenibacillus sp. JCM 10914]